MTMRRKLVVLTVDYDDENTDDPGGWPWDSIVNSDANNQPRTPVEVVGGGDVGIIGDGGKITDREDEVLAERRRADGFEEALRRVKQYGVTVDEALSQINWERMVGRHLTKSATRHWLYVTYAEQAAPTVHLTDFDQYHAGYGVARTLCGLATAGMEAGDETPSGIAATCKTCRKIVANNGGAPISE